MTAQKKSRKPSTLTLEKREDCGSNSHGRSMSSAPRPCRICGDQEPHHVHHGGSRIEDYFTVGRGQTDFQAALSWQQKYLAATRQEVAGGHDYECERGSLSHSDCTCWCHRESDR
jgi:hypothetical protein